MTKNLILSLCACLVILGYFCGFCAVIGQAGVRCDWFVIKSSNLKIN
jgi:hypothetical protein